MTQSIDASDSTLPDGFDPHDVQWVRLAELNAAGHTNDYETFVPESELDPYPATSPGFETHAFTTHTIYLNPKPKYGHGPERTGKMVFDTCQKVNPEDIPYDLSDPDTYWGDVS